MEYSFKKNENVCIFVLEGICLMKKNKGMRLVGATIGSMILVATSAGWAMDPIQIDSGKQLFFDHRFIAESGGVELVMNSPSRAGKVLGPDRPWEDFRLTSYFTVVQDGDLCRMYYSCFSKDQWHTPDAWDNDAFLCYAESRDGIHWDKPNLGIVEFEGSKDNNIILKSVVDGTVFLDPNSPPERRYKLLHTVGPHKGGLRVSYSADGIHFTIPAEPVSPWTPDSQQNAFWDPIRRKYVAFLRAIEEMGISRNPDGAWRRVVRVELDDIEKPWPTETPPIVFAPDTKDLPDVDFYTNACFRYPWADNAYFMFPANYHHFPAEMGNDGLLDVSIACSRDSIEWKRPDRRSYVTMGMEGEWDSKFLMMGVGVVRMGNEIYQYYNGVNLSHGGTRRMADQEREKFRRWGWMGRLVQRLDGFYSADFEYGGGHLLTPPLVFKGNRLTLNINTSAVGVAHAALVDMEGNPYPGFSNEDCLDIMANDIAYTVAWKGGEDVASLAGKPVRLLLHARSTKLYAFQFMEKTP